MKYTHALLTIATIILVALVVPATRGAAEVEGTDITEQADVTPQQLALALAQVCANEAGFRSEADCALIYDASRGFGPTDANRLRWLQTHSRRVLGDRECNPRHNCAWTRNLRWDDTQPEGWPEHQNWVPQHWARLRGWAMGLVDGSLVMHPCNQRPQTWGGNMDHYRAGMLGMELLVCCNPRTGEATRNNGYRYLEGDELTEAQRAARAQSRARRNRRRRGTVVRPTGTVPASVARGR